MKKLNFRYIAYNDEKNILFTTIQNYISNDNLIITEDGMAKKFFFSFINSKKMRVFDNILFLDEFLNKIFFSNKNILKDIKRFLAFYSCLKKEIKESLNIKTYYDCIEVADDFFEFFTYIENEKKLEDLNLSKWQREKINIFFEIKKDFDNFLNNNNYLPLDWLYSDENLDLFYLKNFKKIVFFDIVDFPYRFSEILNRLREVVDVEIVLQMKCEDFDTEKLKIKNITLPEREININLLGYKNDFELYNIIQSLPNEEENTAIYSADINFEDRYSIFPASNKYIFNDTKLYKLLESYVNLIEAINTDKTIDLFILKENLFKAAFMEFYGLDMEDYKNFEEILRDDYRYISLDLLEKGKYDYYFSENINLAEKLKIILRVISDIDDIKNIEDLNQFFRNNFFSDSRDIKYFTEDKYTSIFDKFYEILGLLNSNENIQYFNDFSNFFEKNIGRNIFILFFNYLNKITLYGNENSEQDVGVYLKDLYTAKFFIHSNSGIKLIHSDNLVLPKIRKSNSLFTEQQKLKLNIKSNEELMIIEKYRCFQNLLNFSNLSIYSLVDLDNNIEYSPFIYEYANKYFFKEKNTEIDFVRNLYIETEESVERRKPEFRAYKKESRDFKNGLLKIGAYDYMNIINEETFFFLDKLCGLNSVEEAEEINGISPKVLGIIVHKTMEDIFKNKWKEILSSNHNLLIPSYEISEILRTNIKRENLKIEKFMKYYLDDVLIERLRKNIEKFLKFLYEQLKEEKILRIEAEKNSKREVPFLEKNGIQVFLTGRADLVIETDRARYIIDLKTGKAYDEQLKFYAVMFYLDDNSLPIYSFAYNLWNESENQTLDMTKAKRENILEIKEEISEKISAFLEEPFYKLPKASKLKENNFDFNAYYNYRKLCPLDKIGDDE